MTSAQTVKTLARLLLIIAASLGLVRADDEMLPPKDSRAKWEELHERNFSDWNIQSFLGWDVPFDGGSKVFFFESDKGERFDLVVANPAYWTAEDKKEHRQVFLVLHKNRFYRIEPRSDEEKNMIEKLAEAAERLSGEGKKDPKLLTSLAKRLKSRAPAFKTKG
ncbi:hypothetical protein [Haloferula sp.]|uniref:hypothetical protein n=1 Tax=Haloferula sp. TaxID=2497595 RepID=UPI00329BA492